MSGLVPLNAGHSFRAQNNVERLSPVDPGISRVVTYLYPSRGYTPHNTRDRRITQVAKLSFDQKPFWSISQMKSIFFFLYIYAPSFPTTRTIA